MPSKKDDGTEEVEKLVKDTKTIIDRALGDIGKSSATKQLLLGAASGWVTGFMAKQVGKIAAIGIGTGVIALHIASQNGYININWDAMIKKMDDFEDKLEKEATGKSPAWTDKVERFVDRKIDKAEDLLKKKQVKAKRWFNKINEDGQYRATETHVFVASFIAGLAIGLMCGR